MKAITNQTRKPHWDAHGRLIRPGGIIAFENEAPPDSETAEPPEGSLAPKAQSQPDAKGGKAATK